MSNPGPELFKAMLAFQATNPSVTKGGYNPHFKSHYITLEDLTAVARGCNKHGLVFYQYLDGGADGSDFCVTTVAHAESGQYVEARVRLLYGKVNPQGQGSATTFARRYGLGTLFALCETEDDDAIKAMESTGRRMQKNERTNKSEWSGPRPGGDDNVPFDSGVQDDLRTPESKAVREQEEAAVEHHPSWEQSRNFFHGIIARIGVDYYELCDWLSTKNPPLNKRPSEMDERQRQRLTDFLCGDRGLHQFLNWKEER